MERHLVGKRPTFHRGRSGMNSYLIMALLLINMSGIWLILQMQAGEIKPLFYPTPTPTRMAQSYLAEAEAYFAAGKIDDPLTNEDAIGTYRMALEEDPENAYVWAEMARILTYSSALLTNREERLNRLQEARQAIDQAKELAPEDSTVRAIRSFVLNWNSYYAGDEKTASRFQIDATDEAYTAITLDSNNALALAYYAEIVLDQFKWDEAVQYIDLALEKAQESGQPSMDIHRVKGKVEESLGNYNNAIEQYQLAADINPNMTFLYIYIGVNYRHLANTYSQDQLYERALEYFDRAAKINERNGVNDPLPYIAIAKTYTQMGEFFIAARNGEKALSLNPTDPNSYGQLGIIYFRARNYESAMPALKCAVTSCSSDENLVLERLKAENSDWGIELLPVQAMPLDNIEVAYYYAMYGQVLAYLSRPRENYCAQAYPILEAVRNSPYGRDEVLITIIDGSETICRRLDSGASTEPDM
jgi:tetratricopeptide (TPR) repeat protein